HVVNSYPVPTANAQPAGITKGPDGNLWFTELGSGMGGVSHVGLISPTTHVATEFTVSSFQPKPASIVTGSDGNLWFAESGGSRIGMVNAASHAVKEYPYAATTAGVPSRIAKGPDGNLWFTQQTSNQVGMINPTTHVTVQFTVPTSAANPLGITTGQD